MYFFFLLLLPRQQKKKKTGNFNLIRLNTQIFGLVRKTHFRYSACISCKLRLKAEKYMKAEKDGINGSPLPLTWPLSTKKKGCFNCKCNVLTEKIDLTQRKMFLSKDIYTCEATIVDMWVLIISCNSICYSRLCRKLL